MKEHLDFLENVTLRVASGWRTLPILTEVVFGVTIKKSKDGFRVCAASDQLTEEQSSAVQALATALPRLLPILTDQRGAPVGDSQELFLRVPKTREDLAAVLGEDP